MFLMFSKNLEIILTHYFSRPVLSWDAMLNMTKVDIELISDTEKYFFLKKRYDGMGGGERFSHLQEISKERIKAYDILKCG